MDFPVGKGLLGRVVDPLGTPLVLNPLALDRLGLTLCLAQRFSLPLRLGLYLGLPRLLLNVVFLGVRPAFGSLFCANSVSRARREKRINVLVLLSDALVLVGDDCRGSNRIRYG